MFNSLVTSISMKILPYTIRRFSLSTATTTNKYRGREGRFMDKLINPTKKKRKYIFCESPVYSGGGINFSKELRPSKENNKRIAVLNKLFIKHISDLLATGSFSENFLDKGLEISRVDIASDFKHLNVYWITNNEKNLKALEELLPKLGFSLRHELSQLRVMGNVPKIIFVKDKHHALTLQVDHLLKIADYGEGHVPFHSGSDFKNSQELQEVSTKSQEHCVNADGDDDNKEQQPDEEFMPVMRQDIFNLDHERIMKKIVKSMHKARALHRFEPNLTIASEGTKHNSGDIISDMSKQERKQAISKFILERKLQKMRQNKFDNSNLNHPSYQVSEFNSHNENNYNDGNEDLLTEEDYIEEDSFEDKRYN